MYIMTTKQQYKTKINVLQTPPKRVFVTHFSHIYYTRVCIGSIFLMKYNSILQITAEKEVQNDY